VIGGGVGGCSVLDSLTRLGWDDVVLVERAELTLFDKVVTDSERMRLFERG
jgi:hypothetical protein